MKNTPAAKPNWAAVSARSLLMPFGPAKEIAVRSRKLIKNINATNGTSRNATLRIADFSTALAVVSMLSPQLIEQGHCQINNNLIFRRRFRTSASDDGFASLRQLHPD